MLYFRGKPQKNSHYPAGPRKPGFTQRGKMQGATLINRCPRVAMYKTTDIKRPTQRGMIAEEEEREEDRQLI